MVKGILADVMVTRQVELLVQRMQAEPWTEIWQSLGIVLMRFDDIGLAPDSSDLDIWQICQVEQLVLVTDNRNKDSPDSLEATIRQHNTPQSLPVFTIGDLDKFQSSASYAERVLEKMFDYLSGLTPCAVPADCAFLDEPYQRIFPKQPPVQAMRGC
jgi:hypothetical protein